MLVGFNLGPLTILASVFTTLTVFNLLFARWLLKERVTRAKVLGCCLVLLGAVAHTHAIGRIQSQPAPPPETGSSGTWLSKATGVGKQKA